jgi:transcriptional regulator with XRE-family HTH domain
MGAVVRAIDRGARLGERFLRDVGAEFHDTRIGLGLSQEHVAHASRVSRSRYGRIEQGKAPSLSVLEFARVASILGLDPSIRLYPGGPPVRDSAHAQRLRRLLDRARPPLRARTEVPLPVRPDRHELRAWDAVLYRASERGAVEMEMRLRDIQALERRLALKRRDDHVEAFLLVVADTRVNRRVLADLGGGLAGLARLKRSEVFAALEGGGLPPTGLVLL